MSKSDKIKLNLFDLKPKAELLSVLKFFQENLSTWFDHSGAPLGQFFEARACPLCGSSDNVLYEIDLFNYHRCLACGSIFTSHVPETGYCNIFMRMVHTRSIRKTWFGVEVNCEKEFGKEKI